jgi:hypothetical protein
MTYQRIRELATLANAQAHEQSNERFTFCIDLLDISAHGRRADHWVDTLESVFAARLSSHRVTHVEPHAIKVFAS